jgi:group II intron reverse transcriptase/maturase
MTTPFDPVPVTGPGDHVRDLQQTLYRAAKADPSRRFHALHDKLSRSDVLERAWRLVRASGGASGIDRITLADIERDGVEHLLDALAAELRTGSYRPLPNRRVWIPKPGTRERRGLAVPAVRDRVVQTALKLVLEPIFEADFRPSSFGFRPGKAAHDALQVLLEEAWRGRRWVVETDIASCFEAIPHDRLVAAVERRVSDGAILRLLRAFLRAGVMEERQLRRPITGTPQGGVISPLLANVYLTALDGWWERHGSGVLTRYADDLVVMCADEAGAQRALDQLRALLARLDLAPKETKTRIVHVQEGGEGFDFLGFEHRWVRAEQAHSRHITYLARWPSRRAMAHARERLRELTGHDRLGLPVEVVVQEVNAFLRGWTGYFRYGNSTRHFERLSFHARDRVARYWAMRHAWTARHGAWSANRLHWLGLLRLTGLVVTPRPNWGWRGGAECRR